MNKIKYYYSEINVKLNLINAIFHLNLLIIFLLYCHSYSKNINKKLIQKKEIKKKNERMN